MLLTEKLSLLFFFINLQYIILLIVVFLLEISAGAVAYIYERNISDELNITLSETFMKGYAVNEYVTQEVDLMQQNLKCCGAVRFEEYRDSFWLRSKNANIIRDRGERLVPDSCCVTVTPFCGRSDHPSNIPYTVSIFYFYQIPIIIFVIRSNRAAFTTLPIS